MAGWTPPSSDKVTWTPPSSDQVSSAAPTPAAPVPQKAAGSNWFSSAVDWAKQKEKEVLQKNYALGRGLATGAAGMLGETEKLATQTVPSWFGQAQTKTGPWGTGTIFPTNETVSKGLTAVGAKPSAQPTTEAQGQFLGSFFNPAKKLEAGAAALREASGAAPRAAEATSDAAGWLEKFLGGKPTTNAVKNAVAEARAAGYKLMPSTSLGFGKAAQELVNPAKGAAADANYARYEQTLARLAGLPKGAKIDEQTLAAANKTLGADFSAKLAGKSVNIDENTAAAVRSLIEKQPAIAQEVVGGKGVSSALQAASTGGKMSAQDWFSMVRQLKAMRYSSTEPNVQAQLSAVIDNLEGPVKQMSPSVKRAYDLFNQQYRANATLLNTLSGDVNFLQTGKINPVKIWSAIINSSKSAGKDADLLTTADPFTKINRVVTQLNLVPNAREAGDEQILNAATAAMHAAGAPVHLSVSSANVIPKMASAFGLGKGGRALYGSEMGQRLLAGGNAGLPSARGAIGPTANVLNQTLPSTDQQ